MTPCATFTRGEFRGQGFRGRVNTVTAYLLGKQRKAGQTEMEMRGDAGRRCGTRRCGTDEITPKLISNDVAKFLFNAPIIDLCVDGL